MLTRAHFSNCTILLNVLRKKEFPRRPVRSVPENCGRIVYQIKSLKIKPFGACRVSPLFLRYSGFRKRRWILLSSTASRY